MKNISVVLMVLLSLVAARAHALDSSETVKIQYLIASVEALEGAKFIRNGREYSARAASGHLRLNLRAAGNKVKTAEDFIKFCASNSNSKSFLPSNTRFTMSSPKQSGYYAEYMGGERDILKC
jgi:hypothetical protein